MTPADWTSIIDKYGLSLAVVALFIFGLIRGVVVMGRELADKDKQLDEKRGEIAELKALARQDSDTNQKAVHAAWQLVNALKDATAAASHRRDGDDRTAPSG